MYLVAIAWMYVVLMMTAAEALSPQGTLLGAFFTLLLYGVLPLSILMYILGTPGRLRARRTEAVESTPPDGDGVAAGDTVAAERKEP